MKKKGLGEGGSGDAGEEERGGGLRRVPPPHRGPLPALLPPSPLPPPPPPWAPSPMAGAFRPTLHPPPSRPSSLVPRRLLRYPSSSLLSPFLLLLLLLASLVRFCLQSGEGMAAIPVIKRCLRELPHFTLLMTTTTVSALYEYDWCVFLVELVFWFFFSLAFTFVVCGRIGWMMIEITSLFCLLLWYISQGPWWV